MTIGKIGITVSVWDTRGCMPGSQHAWIDPEAIQEDRRAIYEEVCAAAWPLLNDALDAARATTSAVTNAPVALGDHQ